MFSLNSCLKLFAEQVTGLWHFRIYCEDLSSFSELSVDFSQGQAVDFISENFGEFS